MTRPLKVIFAGTPDFAAQHLAALIDSEHEIVAVYSQPDRPAGRGKKNQASAVKQLAVSHQLRIEQPESLRSTEAQQTLSTFNADIMIVVAYGLILPPEVLTIPALGCLNVHGSVLPKWRGAAPIQRAIWAGDSQTGITIMQMDEGLDTGDILYIERLPIQKTDTSATLYQKLSSLGPTALLAALSSLSQLAPTAQDDALATYANKLSKDEAKIDWTTPAVQIERNIRAFNPWPVCWIDLPQGPVKVWQADVVEKKHKHKAGTILQAGKAGIDVAASSDILSIKVLQIPGKKAMPVEDILNARQSWFSPGSILP